MHILGTVPGATQPSSAGVEPTPPLTHTERRDPLHLACDSYKVLSNKPLLIVEAA